MAKSLRSMSLLAFLAALAAQAAAFSLQEFLVSDFPDNGDIRQKHFTSLITASKEVTLGFKDSRLASRAGQVRVRTLRQEPNFYVFFSNGGEGEILDYSRGSYIIERSSAKGYLVQAKVFLHSDPSCYARLYPQAESTRMDIIMFGAVMKRGVYVPGMFYNVLTKPFSEIVSATKSAVNWESVFAPSAEARNPWSDAERRAAAASSLLESASGFAGFSAFLADPGQGAREFAPSTTTVLGFADDREIQATRLPYAALPRYEPGRGVPAPGLRAQLYLSVLEDPARIFLLWLEGFQVLALPERLPDGSFGFTILTKEGTVSWSEYAAQAAGRPIRVASIAWEEPR